MTEVEQPPQNGIDLSAAEDDENSKARPADIEQDVREMERRKRVEAIMGSKLFREELERIVDCARDSGNTAGLFQQLSDIVGVPASRVGSVFKASNCMLPINDIRGVESMGYAKGEKILRCKLAAAFRLLDLNGWTQGLGAQITARLKVDQEYFLVNPYGLLYHEITASSLNKVDMQGNVVEQGTTNFGVNKSNFILHSIVHAARPDIRCVIYIGCSAVVAIASLKTGLLPLTKDACVLGELTAYSYTGYLHDEEERNKLVRNLGPNSKVMLLTNHGALCCGETIEEAFFAACHIVQACETQLKLLPVGLDNLVLIPEESRKMIYEQSRRPPEDLEKKFAAATAITDSNKIEEEKKEGGETTTTTTTTTTTKVIGQPPKWRVGGAEFEALMRMLDNAGYRTGYIYRHPLIKSDPPKPKNDVELPPAVSSLGYLLEEEELFRQGIWKKGDLRKGGDRSRWLNSPNVYQKVEVLETGTPDPKKITKWVADSSPTHSTPVRIDDALQFVPVNTNPREFKRVQQQIKDNRRADKISAGPQSHILEGVTWDEANRIKDATVSSAGDHVVLMGAASKGIIQRGFQHNATVYKTPYAKNPFDNVTDDELNEYKRTVERKKKSIHGEYTDTDFSESEALSSLQTSGAQQQTKQTTTTTTTTTAAVSQSEPEDISEHQVMRIKTQQAPVPSQPEVVLSDASLSFINGERSHTVTNRKPPTGRDAQILMKPYYQVHQDIYCPESLDISYHSIQLTQYKSAIDDVSGTDEEEMLSHSADHQAIHLFTNDSHKQNFELIKELKTDSFFQKQKEKNLTPPIYTATQTLQGNGSFSNISQYVLPYQQSKCKINRLSSDQLDNSSYYTCCCDNSSTLKSSTDYCSTIYVNPSNTNPCSDYMNSKRAYIKSIYCCTPQICNAIFESLQMPNFLQRQCVSKSQQDLVWNRTLNSHNCTPLSTPGNQNTPRKARIDNARTHSTKSNSPYRTLSHFGFNSPQREVQPDHKHLPVNTEPKKYVPLRRSISYEEIFSSPRYVDLCEHCFEQILRLKPDLMQYRTKLYNLAEYQVSPPTTPKPVKSPTIKHIHPSTECSGYDDFNNTVAISAGLDNYKFPLSEEEEPQEEQCTVFSPQLEPVLEVEESDSSTDHLPEISMTNSTFIDRITRMNYSEESANMNYFNTPHTVTSQISLPDIEEDYEMESPTQVTINASLIENLQGLNLNEEPEDYKNNLEMSITEIANFAKWLDNVMEEEPPENLETSSKTASPKYFNQEFEKHPSRTLMNRDERTRRKLEFQELLEDHVRYGANREQYGNNASCSDTESAIDETQHPNSPSQETEQATNDSEQMSIIDLTKDEEEIFHGTSLVFAETYHLNHNIEAHKSQHLYEEHFDKEDAESTSSCHTFNISERNSSKENLLLSTQGCASEGYVHTTLIKQARNNESLNDSDGGNVNNLSGTQSPLNNKTSFEYYRPHGQQPYQGIREYSYSEIPNENLDVKDQANSESKIYIKEFDDIVRQEYDVNSNVSENLEDNLHRLDQINVEEEQVIIGEIRESESEIVVEVPDDTKIMQRDGKMKELEEKESETFRETKGQIPDSQDYGKTPSFPNPSEDMFGKIEHIGDNEQFSSLERTILEKIEINQLSKSGEIFDKIENSIRNKMTPSKLEMLIKEQALQLFSGCGADNDTLYNLTTTHNKKDKFLLSKPGNLAKGDYKMYCRSRSLTQLNENSSPPSKLNHTLTPPKNPEIESDRSNPDSSNTTPSPCSSKTSMSSNKKRRNFILENIRNASVPQIKRLQGNTQAIFGKNPFGPPSITTSVNTVKKTLEGFANSPSYKKQQIVSPVRCASSGVHTFQSKIVKGSPRFWVSMSQSPVKKLPAILSKSNRKCNRKFLAQEKPSDTTVTTQEENCVSNLENKTFNFSLDAGVAENTPTPSTNVTPAEECAQADVVTKVDAEINALGEEIQQIQPRLETYKRKLDDFGDRVAKCARNMDEFVDTQEEIYNEQRELRERIILQQFTEEIFCRIQTFSLSETDD